MQHRDYFDTVMCDLTDVIADKKSLLIVSSGKSTRAYEMAVMLANHNHLSNKVCTLRCADGKLHEHILIGREAHQGYVLIDDCKAGRITRPQLQHDLGKLLGYTMRDILDFIASAVARECPCDCCGGPFVNEKFFDTSPPPAGYEYTMINGTLSVDVGV